MELKNAKRPVFAALLIAMAGITAITAMTAAPAGADWLVAKDGGRVETKGAWTVKGKLVVFQTADGKLSSLRLADVDLEASRQATEHAVNAGSAAEAASGKTAPAAPRKTSVLKLTDKDVRHIGESGGDEGEILPETGPAPKSGIAITDWQQSRDDKDGHVVIQGKLENGSANPSADLELSVVLFDDAGTQISTSQAVLTTKTLAPGKDGGFRADFPGFYSFATLKFRLNSSKADSQPAPSPSKADNGG